MFSSTKFFGKSRGEAYFKVGDGQSPDFVLKLTDPEKVNQARRQVQGAEPSLHVTGIIVKETACWNPNYSYRYDPATVDFFELSMEVCDASFRYVQENLADAGGAFLPGLRFCPWSSYLIEEIFPEC